MNLLKNLAIDKYNNNVDLVRKCVSGIINLKTQAKLDKRVKAMVLKEAKKAKSLGRS